MAWPLKVLYLAICGQEDVHGVINVRSGKEFRAYALSPGLPICGPMEYNVSLALDRYIDSLSDNEGDHDVDLESDCDDCDYCVKGAPSFPPSAASHGSPPASSAAGDRSCYEFSSVAHAPSSVHSDETSFSSAPGSRVPPSPEGDPGAFPLPSFGLIHPLLHTAESDALKAPVPDPQKPTRGDAAQLPLDKGKAA
ncbi:hypothetical protein BDP27DRAFT_1372224 [Rhodocollybia butyracea]|uniref:Uncharacterized protein n=1 Tax=Rhodocollybia butyracea TaxID=206335 RepID=A0A9P5P925_9AGAR|nr:hypothetical protein BDP27DRAFT_1372224 [Rhodocollybia butyracea]